MLIDHIQVRIYNWNDTQLSQSKCYYVYFLVVITYLSLKKIQSQKCNWYLRHLFLKVSIEMKMAKKMNKLNYKFSDLYLCHPKSDLRYRYSLWSHWLQLPRNYFCLGILYYMLFHAAVIRSMIEFVKPVMSTRLTSLQQFEYWLVNAYKY